METALHNINELFKQLGLPSSHSDIEDFVERNRPLGPNVALTEAPFWTDSQREFLEQQLSADADWAELVDQLNLILR